MALLNFHVKMAKIASCSFPLSQLNWLKEEEVERVLRASLTNKRIFVSLRHPVISNR